MRFATASASPPAPAGTSPRRMLGAVLVVALALAWVAAAAMPARAASNWGVEQPGAGASVTDQTYVRAFVDAISGEKIEGVRARFRQSGGGGPGQVAELSFASRSGGDAGTERSTWARPFNPLASEWHGGGPVPNGRYVLEVQVVSSVESVDFEDQLRRESEWRGHEIVVDAPPPAASVSAEVADPKARSVRVSWQGTNVPDFRRYELQRARGGGEFSQVHTTSDPQATSFTDTVDEDGDYQYRVRVVRAGADSADKASMSAPAGVAVKKPAGQESSDAGGGGEPGGGDAGGGPSPGQSGAPGISGGGPGSATGDSEADARAPRTAPGPNVDDTIEPPDPNVFDEQLDYGEQGSGRDPAQAPQAAGEENDQRVAREDTSVNDSGLLSVWDSRDLNNEDVLVPVATGLVLTLGGLHVRRFLNP